MEMIWLRITKTGGTSFESAIRTGNLPIKMVTPTYNNVKYFNYDTDNFTFSIIRNPYEKGISSWKWLTEGNGNKRFDKLDTFKKKLSYEEFLKRSIDLRMEYEKYNHSMLESGVIIPNTPFLTPNTLDYEYFWAVQHLEGMYETITTFKQLTEVNEIIRLENFNEEKIIIEDKLGKKINMPHNNKTRSNRNYSQHYVDDKTMRLFLYLYKNDVEKFKYTL